MRLRSALLAVRIGGRTPSRRWPSSSGSTRCCPGQAWRGDASRPSKHHSIRACELHRRRGLPARVGDSPYEVKRLTVLAYWLLVLASLTGLSTLLGRTDTLDAREVDVINAREVDDVLPPHALHPSEAMMPMCGARQASACAPAAALNLIFGWLACPWSCCTSRGQTGRLHLVCGIYHSRWPAPIRGSSRPAKASLVYPGLDGMPAAAMNENARMLYTIDRQVCS